MLGYFLKLGKLLSDVKLECNAACPTSERQHPFEGLQFPKRCQVDQNWVRLLYFVVNLIATCFYHFVPVIPHQSL